MRIIVITFFLSKLLFACFYCGNDEQVYEKLKNELDNCERGLISKTRKVDHSNVEKMLQYNNQKLKKSLDKKEKIYLTNETLYKKEIKLLKYKLILSNRTSKITKTTKMTTVTKRKQFSRKKKITTNHFFTKVDKLIWQDEPYTRLERKIYYTKKSNFGKVGNFSYANEYCKNLTLKGYKHWKLPTKEQLLNLYKNKVQLINKRNSTFWSSTKKSSTRSWVVGFAGGSAFWVDNSRTRFIRCVH